MIFILIPVIGVILIGIVVTINALRNTPEYDDYDEIDKDIYEKEIRK